MLQYCEFADKVYGFEKANFSDQEMLEFAKKAIDECFVNDPCDPVELEGKREEMDTFGNLMDKLAIVTVRMWHAQDDLYRYRRMSKDEWRNEFKDDPDRVRHTLVRACELNLQRNQLMDEIDQIFQDALTMNEEERAKLVQKKHKSY